MPALIALIPQFISAGKSLFDLYAHIRDRMKQTNEWTPELEDQFQATLAAAGTKPEWKPDQSI